MAARVGSSVIAARAAPRQLQKKGFVATPQRDLHVIVPPEYRQLASRRREDTSPSRRPRRRRSTASATRSMRAVSTTWPRFSRSLPRSWTRHAWPPWRFCRRFRGHSGSATSSSGGHRRSDEAARRLRRGRGERDHASGPGKVPGTFGGRALSVGAFCRKVPPQKVLPKRCQALFRHFR
jgi:hypothetical protein